MSVKSDIVVLGLVSAGLYFIYKKGSDLFGGLSGWSVPDFNIGMSDINIPVPEWSWPTQWDSVKEGTARYEETMNDSGYFHTDDIPEDSYQSSGPYFSFPFIGPVGGSTAKWIDVLTPDWLMNPRYEVEKIDPLNYQVQFGGSNIEVSSLGEVSGSRYVVDTLVSPISNGINRTGNVDDVYYSGTGMTSVGNVLNLGDAGYLAKYDPRNNTEEPSEGGGGGGGDGGGSGRDNVGGWF